MEEVKGQREMPDIKPGYIVQLKVVREFVFEDILVLVFCVHENCTVFYYV